MAVVRVAVAQLFVVQTRNQGGYFPPPKFLNHCMAILTFSDETQMKFKNKDEILYSNHFEKFLLKFFSYW